VTSRQATDIGDPYSKETVTFAVLARAGPEETLKGGDPLGIGEFVELPPYRIEIRGGH
jgi:hypothetical protein